MNTLEKLLAGGLVLLLVVLTSLTLSLRNDVQSLAKNPTNQKLAGVTNLDELAPGEEAIRIYKLEFDPDDNATSTAFACRADENFSRWIDLGNTQLTVDATSTSAAYRVQGATTTGAISVYATSSPSGHPTTSRFGGGGFLSTASTAMAYAPLVDTGTIATASPSQIRTGSTTPFSRLEWKAGECIGVVVRATADTNYTGGHAATSSGSGLRKITLTVPTYATSTSR